jgi:hypothetical protein
VACHNRVLYRCAVAGFVGALVTLAAPSAWAQPRWGRPQTPRAGACFYRDADFRGDFFCVPAGDDVAILPNGMNDQISSIRTFGRVTVTVFQNGRYSGRSERFDSDVRNLRDRGWNDALSSMRVSRPFGDGNRPGDAMTRAKAEEIVRRAYRSVLNRDPDPASQPYIDKVLRERWTEEDVARELRKSDEYRRKR